VGYIAVMGFDVVKDVTLQAFPNASGIQFSHPVLKLQAVQYLPHPRIIFD
jgi:hypothetical protein